MKKILTIFFILSFVRVSAQKIPDMSLYKVRLYEKDKTISAEINEVNSAPHIRPRRFYYWYNANAIQSTQGGYSGKLLNGLYTEYYLNKNLKEEGVFNKGLKTGLWKSWNEDGTLNHTARWRKGVLIPAGRSVFWKKIKIFSWLKKRPRADSVKTPAGSVKH